ncbi:MAG TPA: carboxypeptidase regulatory-like domain-containing protein [Bryobacteraceae bacterium]|nr:carboxypeptidase regulatory-like domain-containing protein [Bryobacteraceae bacterium]
MSGLNRILLRRQALMLAAALLLAAASLAGQTTASILGTITDESGALVAGAAVTAVNTLTNEVRTTTTDQAGYYRFAELGIGMYKVRAELQGFKTVIRDGLELSLNRNARVDIQLPVGTLTDSVSVVADAPLVEATTNEMGALVNQTRVVELPLNTRNTLSLVSLVPGAQQVETGNAQGFLENRVSINGAREEDSNWLLDGGGNTSPLRNYGNVVPNPDAVQEFRVITSNYSAEFGSTVGAVVNVVTRSGSNEFHGTAFNFLRNRSLNARDFFEPDTTPLVQNQFGGTMGGRILRDKTFFFTSFEGQRRRRSQFENGALVPTAAERGGDFSKTVFGGGPIVVRDPSNNNQPFPNNIIPTNRLSPVALSYLDLAVPLPNTPGRGPNALEQRGSEPLDSNQMLGKIDHVISDKHKLSGAYFISDQVDRDRFPEDLDFAYRDMKSRQHNLNIHEFWTIGPTKLNHFRATYTRSSGDRHVMPDDITLADLGSNFTPLPDGPKMPPDFEVVGWFDNGTANGGPKYANQYVVADTFDWLRGRHELKFGVEGSLLKMNDVSTAPGIGGAFKFDGLVTGNAMSDLLLGRAATADIQKQTYKSQNSWGFRWFVQDKFRLTRKLVLNLGVRHDLDTWPVNPLDALVAWQPGRQSSCVPQAPRGIVFPCDDGIPRAGVRGDYNNFAPRVGIVYDLTGDGKTVVRSGYGISYAFSFMNALQEQLVSAPYTFRETLRNPTLEQPYDARNGGNPFPFKSDPANLRFGNVSYYSFQEFDMRTAYVQQWNLTLQRQISNDWSAEVAYVGNVGRKLIGQYDANSPLRAANASKSNVDFRRPLYPSFKEMRAVGGFVNSSYNALQARVESRFSKGFTASASYTFGKAIDESSWYSSRTEWADTRSRSLNKGLGDTDRRHLLAVSWVWDVPRPGGTARLTQFLFDGWSLNGIATFYSGAPVFIITNRDNDYDGNASGDRPDVVGGWKLSPSRARSEVVAAWFKQSAFVENQKNQLGNLGRNVVIGPGTKQVDLGISRVFRMGERQRIQFRAETFNICNWVNLQNPEEQRTNGLFGVITDARDPRIIQFGLKFLF